MSAYAARLEVLGCLSVAEDFVQLVDPLCYFEGSQHAP